MSLETRHRNRSMAASLVPVVIVSAILASAGSAFATGQALKPSIASFSPTNVKMATVTIHGKNFTGTKTVKIDGLTAKFKTVSSTEIIATVPSKAKSGKIIIATAAGSVTSTAILKIALAAHPAAQATIVNVIAGKPSEFKYTLSAKSVKHGTVTFKLTDKGVLPHSLKICSSPTGGTANTCTGKATPTISPGGSATLKVTFTKPGSYEYLCTVPGHALAGMKGDLKVV